MSVSVGQVLVVALVALLIVVALLMMRRRRRRIVVVDEFAPALYVRTNDPDAHVLPELILFPADGQKARIGAHPAYMDQHVGDASFARLAAVDVRGDQASVREVSRHAACIWREPHSGACFVQLGWPGPGEPIRPRTQTRVLRLGRPHDAASQPFRLTHGDVLRLSSRLEYVFREVDPLRDRPTPEQKKIEAFESSTSGSSTLSGGAKLSLLRQRARDPSDENVPT